MKITLEQELYFMNIAFDIINHDEFIKLKNYNHHYSLTRFEHCIDVAYHAYIRAIKKKKELDLKSIIRAALLHDFFIYDIRLDDINNHLKSHPITSLNTALDHFVVNDIEREIILTHMWPLNNCKPRSIEAKLVNTSDKYCAIYEFFKIKKRYRLRHCNLNY